jgi:hypothetical protein
LGDAKEEEKLLLFYHELKHTSSEILYTSFQRFLPVASITALPRCPVLVLDAIFYAEKDSLLCRGQP